MMKAPFRHHGDELLPRDPGGVRHLLSLQAQIRQFHIPAEDPDVGEGIPAADPSRAPKLAFLRWDPCSSNSSRRAAPSLSSPAMADPPVAAQMPGISLRWEARFCISRRPRLSETHICTTR